MHAPLTCGIYQGRWPEPTMIALSEKPNMMNGRPADAATNRSTLAPGTAAWELHEPKKTPLTMGY